MAEFQRKKAEEELTSALSRLGLEVSPELKPPGARGAAMGPGETAPASMAEIASQSPDYDPPAPADVPTLPRGLPDDAS
ncbi:MAG TPA: hypothetical protein VHL54_08495 [Actinomycetota bacterium]|nr:hypothetical protein [Actinomycetota bacterium]